MIEENCSACNITITWIGTICLQLMWLHNCYSGRHAVLCHFVLRVILNSFTLWLHLLRMWINNSDKLLSAGVLDELTIIPRFNRPPRRKTLVSTTTCRSTSRRRRHAVAELRHQDVDELGREVGRLRPVTRHRGHQSVGRMLTRCPLCVVTGQLSAWSVVTPCPAAISEAPWHHFLAACSPLLLSTLSWQRLFPAFLPVHKQYKTS